jgi:hypothetical protein
MRLPLSRISRQECRLGNTSPSQDYHLYKSGVFHVSIWVPKHFAHCSLISRFPFIDPHIHSFCSSRIRVSPFPTSYSPVLLLLSNYSLHVSFRYSKKQLNNTSRSPHAISCILSTIRPSISTYETNSYERFVNSPDPFLPSSSHPPIHLITPFIHTYTYKHINSPFIPFVRVLSSSCALFLRVIYWYNNKFPQEIKILTHVLRITITWYFFAACVGC